MKVKSILKGEVRPDFIRNETLTDLFESSAKKNPGKTALQFDGHTINYLELDNWSNDIANYLNETGVLPGSLVGVYWPRGLELHALILGICKSGAAYIPIDAETPLERVETILAECSAGFCFSKELLAKPVIALKVPAFFREAKRKQFESNALPANLAYIIYTSGTTGKPKGIPIRHNQVCHFVRAEQSVLNIVPEDKVYQGFSVSFDMWCEETWISYFAGASLCIADSITAKGFDEIPEFLRKNKITVLHAVPSLLAMMEPDVPSLRLINAGGEACTKTVLQAWSRPGRSFFNSYGPTETTVTAAISKLNSGDEISIGLPLPNYNLAVVDEHLEVRNMGQAGELVISGPGLSSGYIGLAELSREKFPDKPACLSELPGEKIYRTGDLAIIHETGRVEIRGRIDDQVKLRGYRIELGEIEGQISLQKEVVAAAAALKRGRNGQDELVAYYVVAPEQSVSKNQLRLYLAKVLPSYMVPGFFVSLAELPRMTSGKIDRTQLPLPEEMQASSIALAEKDKSAGDTVQDRVLFILKKIFPGRALDMEMDFFQDLNGHSMLAASFVSQIRKDAGLTKASIRDIYQHRPIKALLRFWVQVNAEEKAKGSEKAKIKTAFLKIPLARYLLCFLAQTIALPLIFGMFACQIFFPYLGYYYVQQSTDNHLYALLIAFLLFCFIPPLLIFTGVLSKWLVIGKVKEGDYPQWGLYYFRFWFVKTMQELVPVQFLNNTPLYPIYLRMLGATVAKNAQLSSVKIGAEDLVNIGNDVSISSDVNLNNVVMSGGLMKIRSIRIGDHAYIGTGSVLSGGSVMEAWTELQDLSFLPEKNCIAEREIWTGSPARKTGILSPDQLPQPLVAKPGNHLKFSFYYFFLLLVFPLALLTPFFPIIYIISWLDEAAPDYNFNYMIYFPLLTLIYQVLFVLFTSAFSRMLTYDIRPGQFPLHSAIYVRKWLSDQLMSLSLIVLHPLYATLYIRPFFRLLGTKVGKDAEISTASNVTHALLKIGNGAFVADAVKLGEADIRAQQIILNETTVGSNSFVGNSAVIPQGYSIPDNTLIGVLSTPPKAEQIEAGKASDWFGSPAIALPKRETSQTFPTGLTTKPTLLRYLSRAATELVRIVIPESAILCFSVLLIAYAHDLLVDEPWWKFMLYFPFYYLGFIGIPAFLVTVILKWLAVGRFRSRQMPLWTPGVWKSEAITVIYEALAVPFLLNFLKGTAWLPFLLRLLGVKIGKRVYMNTTDLTEFDQVSIGDDTALNDDCGPQTHLFEDRIMKIGPVKIGARSSIGALSIVLYDTEVGDDVEIKPLSLVMKGERLPDSTTWCGSPVSPVF